jgi:hypothetical protein
MFEEVRNFIDDHFFLIWCLTAGYVLTAFGVMAWRQASNGPQFPPLESVNVLHRERFASGCSHRSLLTRLGGARNMLDVVLTDTELWVTTFAYLRGISVKYDLDYRIPLIDVVSVEKSWMRSVVIHFHRSDRTTEKLQLWLRDREEFLAKLQPLIGDHARSV